MALRYHFNADITDAGGAGGLALREAGEDGYRWLDGRAIVFGEKSRFMGFYEVISPGVQIDYPDTMDVRALYNHNSDYIMGRQANGSLMLNRRMDGLHVSIRVPDTTYGRDVAALVAEGTLRGMSFGFATQREWESYDAPSNTFTVNRMVLHETSIVGNPAYPDTTIMARDLLAAYAEPEPAPVVDLTAYERRIRWAERQIKINANLAEV